MAKIAVVFHSVCGNTYQLAACFTDYLAAKGQEVSLYRVQDETYPALSLQFEPALEYREEIMEVPVIKQGMKLTGYDAVFLGSPTYYGCVSAQMKAFMDSFSDIWADAKMAGKFFGCFATGGDVYGGTELCMQVMNTFAQHMGMIPVSVPCNAGGAPQPAYGITHISGAKSDVRMDGETVKAVHGYLDHFINILESIR